MALINCPECGKENVSDSAEACPNCGYGIKAHFEKIKQDEERERQNKLAEIAKEKAEKRKEDRIKSVPKPEKPRILAPVIIFIISAMCFWGAIILLGVSKSEVERSIAHGEGNPRIYGGVFIIFGIVLVCYGIYLFSKRMEMYNLSKTNFEAYQREVIREQDEKDRRVTDFIFGGMNEQENKPQCPYCHSHNTSKITATSKAINTAMFGVLGQKRKYQWHCNNCKSNF